ncbi:DUF547 domain-containing protein [Desulfoferrobacter suflitae]|uniref:DUF547 domain-containing protein n=1 Tax=Desulfoferrobacter suflitae TaxID=2865782 RepID=UPI00216480BC|nr:DUF547 domain-containing protein [Desulfoferrobacter suflitae]MCK8601851.1 DUF547 domain-containing protein [Desulfoferrobacter suflitae]
MNRSLAIKKCGAPRRPFIIWMAIIGVALAGTAPVDAAPRAELWAKWNSYDASSPTRVDHSSWGRFLQDYLVTDDPSGVNLVRYSKVTESDRKELTAYLGRLQQVKVTGLNRAEQKAYWINLYNALTVRVILDHYPVKSIRDIKPSSGLLGLFAGGPWKAKLIQVEGEKISLDDIEHRILRPIWRDNRVHYAVNCASIGCPNLQPKPLTAENTESVLNKAARDYINHPRGVTVVSSDKFILSSIYDWFREDFGGSRDAVLKHLKQYAGPSLTRQLENFQGKIDYQYDWTLNDAKP